MSSSKPRDLPTIAEEQRIRNLSDQEAAERIGRVMQVNTLRDARLPWYEQLGWEKTIVTDDTQDEQ